MKILKTGIKFTAIIMILILMLSPLSLKAASSDITASLTSTTQRIKEGDVVEVLFTIHDTKKINGLEADLKDTEYFKVESRTLEGTNTPFYNWATSLNKLEISGNTAEAELKVKIRLKVLKTPTSAVTFTIENIELNEDNVNWTEEAIRVNNVSIQFQPVETPTPPPAPDSDPVPNPGDNSGGNDNGNDSGNGNNNGNGSENGNNNGNGSGNGGSGSTTDGEQKPRATDAPIVIGENDSSSGTKSSSGSSSQGSENGKTNGTAQDNTTVNDKKIVQTGDHDALIFGMIITSIISIIAFVQFRKYKGI